MGFAFGSAADPLSPFSSLDHPRFLLGCRSAKQLLSHLWGTDNLLDLVKEFNGSKTPKLVKKPANFTLIFCRSHKALKSLSARKPQLRY